MARASHIERLLRALHAAGFSIGIDEELRLRIVLSRWLEESRELSDVRDVLAAVLLKSQESRAEFERVFSAWLDTLKQEKVPPTFSPASLSTLRNDQPLSPERKARRIWHRGLMSIVIFIILLAILLISYPARRAADDRFVPTNGPVDSGSDPSHAPPALTVVKVWVATFTVALAPPPASVAGTQRAWTWLLLLSMLAPLVLWLTWRRRSYLPRPAPTPIRAGPLRVLPRVPRKPHNAPHFLYPREEEMLVFGVGQFVSEESTRHLDVGRTVAATVAAGGFPRLYFQPARFAREVWLWSDLSLYSRRDGPGAGVEPLIDELAATLILAGLPLERATFWGVPDTLTTAQGRFLPGEVDERRDAAVVAIFTDGRLLARDLESAIARPRLIALLRQLSHWPRLCFVDCGRKLHRLDELLLPFDIPVLLPEQVAAFIGAQPVQSTRSADSDLWSGADRLWAAACALAPYPLDNEAALRLRRKIASAASPWRLSELRSLAVIHGTGFLFPPAERASRLAWLLASSGGSCAPFTQLGRVLSFYRQELLDEQRRREVAERSQGLAFRNTTAEQHSEMLLALLDLWDRPERAAQRLYEFYQTPLSASIEEQLSVLGPKECAGDPLLVALPWSIESRRPRCRLMLHQMGFAKYGRQWRADSIALRAPIRVRFAQGAALGLFLISLLATVLAYRPYAATGKPFIDVPLQPPGARVEFQELNGNRYLISAIQDKKVYSEVVPAGSRVRIDWAEQNFGVMLADGGAPDSSAGPRDMPPSLPDLAHKNSASASPGDKEKGSAIDAGVKGKATDDSPPSLASRPLRIRPANAPLAALRRECNTDSQSASVCDQVENAAIEAASYKYQLLDKDKLEALYNREPALRACRRDECRLAITEKLGIAYLIDVNIHMTQKGAFLATMAVFDAGAQGISSDTEIQLKREVGTRRRSVQEAMDMVLNNQRLTALLSLDIKPLGTRATLTDGRGGMRVLKAAELEGTREVRVFLGSYVIHAQKPGFISESQAVTVGQVGALVAIELKLQPVAVKFEWSPEDVRVLVDGELVDGRDKVIELVEGPHKVEAIAPKGSPYESTTFNVIVQIGMEPIRIVLRRLK